MKVGIISPQDPRVNRRTWSGTVYKSREAIESAGFEIVHIPLKKNGSIWVYYIFYKIIAWLRGRRSNPLYSKYIAKKYAKNIDKKLLLQVDYLFVAAMTPYVAYLDTSIPLIFLTDSTFKLYCDYYPSMTNLLKKNKIEGLALDALIYQKAAIIICSSDWSKKSIVDDFCVSEGKVNVLEFGPNIDENRVIVNNKKINTTKLELLFIGVNWERKGGDVAVETCFELNKMGFHSTLHVVGCALPRKYSKLSWIREYGFLDKNNPSEYNLFVSIIKNSDLFILPTIAESAGIVFAEASAYSLPIFTYNTGGVANYVVNGLNGYRLPTIAVGLDFAKKIKLCIDNNELSILKEGCTKYSYSNLNWNVWSNKFKEIINGYEEKKASQERHRKGV